MTSAAFVNLNNFLNRLPPNAPPAVARHIETLAKLSHRFGEKAATIRKDPTLSPQGQAERILTELAGGFGDHFGQIKKEIDGARASIAGEIGRMRERALELQGEFPAHLQREVRDYLRSLSESDRRRFVLENSDEPLVAVSLLNAPAFLSGISSDIYGHVEQHVVESVCGSRLTELEVDHSAWENAAVVCKVVANELAREAGITSEGFEKVAA